MTKKYFLIDGTTVSPTLANQPIGSFWVTICMASYLQNQMQLTFTNPQVGKPQDVSCGEAITYKCIKHLK